MAKIESHEHRDLAKGALINVLGILAKTPKAVYFLVFARLFGAEIFGLYLLAVSVVEVSSKIGCLGLDWGLLRLVVQLKARGREAEIRPTIYRVLALGFASSLTVALLLALSAPFVADRIMEKRELAEPLQLICLAMPFLTMSSIILYAIRANRRMQYEMIVHSIVEPSLIMLGGLFAALFARRIEVLALAYAFAAAGGTTVAFIYLRRSFPRGSLVSGTSPSIAWGELLVYSLPMGGMDLLNNFKQKVDIMVIGRFLSLTHVGVFGAIIELGNLLRKVRQAFEPVFMPIVTYLHEVKEKERLQRHFALATRWIMSVALVIFIPMLFAPDVFLRVFGAQFMIGQTSLMIYAVGMFFFVTLGMSENVLSMTGHPYVNLVNSLALVGINLLLLILLVPSYGLEGAATATALSYTALGALLMVQTFYIVGVHSFARPQLKVLGAGVISLAVCLVGRALLHENMFLEVALVVPLFFGVYIGAIWMFGLEAEDFEILGKLRNRVPRFKLRKTG